LAARFEEAFGVKATLIPEGRGIFDVVVDGERVYSKFETGEFPDERDLVERVRRKD